MPWAEISGIIAELLKLVNLWMTRKNDAASIQATLATFHQQLKDNVANLDATLSDPNATPAAHQAALDKLRIADAA